MTDLQLSSALVASADLYLGGLKWNKDHGLQQVVIALSEEEAAVLGVSGRLDRVTAAGGQKARPTILSPIGQGAPRLLLSGTEVTIQAMKDELDRILGKDGRSVPIHPYDTAALRKPMRKLPNFEAESGCRVVLEDQQKLRLTDPIGTPRRHCVRLFGEKAAQARALGLLAPHLQHSDTPLKDTTLASDYANACEDWLTLKSATEGKNQPLEGFFRRMPDAIELPNLSGSFPIHIRKDASAEGPGSFYSFSPTVLGEGLELPPASNVNTVVRQRLGLQKASLQGLVVAGKGELLPFALGGFFALKVLKMDMNRKTQGGVKVGIPRGGTRIGVSIAQLEAPAPATLLTKPKESWVLGRGFVRGPDGKTSRCEAADLDSAVVEGDEIGLLVLKDTGALTMFRRSDRYAEWTCMLHWEARISDPQHCFALLELSGSILEVELLHGRQPPSFIERDVDMVQLPKRVWP